MIFNQFLDEDEGELMAQRLQQEMYGGGGASVGGAGGMNSFGGMMNNDPNVRQPD